MKQKKFLGIFICILFTVMTFLFTRGFYSQFFILLMSSFLSIPFLNEEKRIVIWMMISFFLGNLAVGYISRFLETFRISPMMLVIADQLLLFLPLFMVIYVLKQFHYKMNSYGYKRTLKKREQSSLLVNRLILACLLFITLLFILYIPHITTKISTVWCTFIITILVSILYAFVQEVLWRGIFLSIFIQLTNKLTGVIVASIVFAINTTMFGTSMKMTFFFVFLGFLFSIVTMKTRNIFPSMILHALIVFLLFIHANIILPQ
ncbi:CPBP family intramembrane glutamic endopeptidase [Neobacillus thermocopriae]|uniref:CPBP family intramembrane metalloprotease n=2 Tax=Neobacillus thermocopriae TaxID=1215031 RepID=A0A6B3TWK5_9BACI|nr:CPBP family intramembrane glutamic endopeptidase [Neobacillus thermocopriae]MED3623609.1 CPBP family intramembrane metalloprotease [Neobacillus thermocopriae]MED3714509.1 CPBP family intramembrane metalloprotease [Neobacillus thermocopriae]NEX80007.1 CPBP family intramembrane metalloprotease [Neobacillus thermocopriae]